MTDISCSWHLAMQIYSAGLIGRVVHPNVIMGKVVHPNAIMGKVVQPHVFDRAASERNITGMSNSVLITSTTNINLYGRLTQIG